jgi:hypothetical protein
MIEETARKAASSFIFGGHCRAFQCTRTKIAGLHRGPAQRGFRSAARQEFTRSSNSRPSYEWINPRCVRHDLAQ